MDEELMRVAERYARSDAEYVIAAAEQTGPMGLRLCIVDGSQFAPSNRAMPGGEQVWAMQDADAWEVYVECFERLIEAWDTNDERALTWDEGCLFLVNALAFDEGAEGEHAARELGEA